MRRSLILTTIVVASLIVPLPRMRVGAQYAAVSPAMSQFVLARSIDR